MDTVADRTATAMPHPPLVPRCLRGCSTRLRAYDVPRPPTVTARAPSSLEPNALRFPEGGAPGRARWRRPPRRQAGPGRMKGFAKRPRRSAMRLLLVEDDGKAAGLLAKGLREEGWIVDVAPSGAGGDELASVNDYDVVVLDWLLPDQDGI